MSKIIQYKSRYKIVVEVGVRVRILIVTYIRERGGVGKKETDELKRQSTNKYTHTL